MAALEGLDAGIPVVGPDGWGPREIIDPPRTGLRFNPGDASDLAMKIIQLLLRKGESADFDPAAGPARVRKHFSVKAHLKRMNTLYHRLTAESCFFRSKFGKRSFYPPHFVGFPKKRTVGFCRP